MLVASSLALAHSDIKAVYALATEPKNPEQQQSDVLLHNMHVQIYGSTVSIVISFTVCVIMQWNLSLGPPRRK